MKRKGKTNENNGLARCFHVVACNFTLTIIWQKNLSISIYSTCLENETEFNDRLTFFISDREN